MYLVFKVYRNTQFIYSFIFWLLRDISVIKCYCIYKINCSWNTLVIDKVHQSYQNYISVIICNPNNIKLTFSSETRIFMCEIRYLCIYLLRDEFRILSDVSRTFILKLIHSSLRMNFEKMLEFPYLTSLPMI